jgi:NAD(P)-dependent dehydrogenase (short-subunit alcohol dehydrogenase family)
MTLSIEEPKVTSISIRPGAVDTQMQQELRDTYASAMQEKDSAKFFTLYKEGGLLKPEKPGTVIAKLVLDGAKNLSGKFLRYACIP